MKKQQQANRLSKTQSDKSKPKFKTSELNLSIIFSLVLIFLIICKSGIWIQSNNNTKHEISIWLLTVNNEKHGQELHFLQEVTQANSVIRLLGCKQKQDLLQHGVGSKYHEMHKVDIVEIVL